MDVGTSTLVTDPQRSPVQRSSHQDTVDIVSMAPIDILTDQGFQTGIGIYALDLYRLLQPTFPSLRLISMDYKMAGPSVPEAVRPNWLMRTNNRVMFRIAQHLNDDRAARSLRGEARLHLCGSSYRLCRRFPTTIATVHDYYPRQLPLRGLAHPAQTSRDLAALVDYTTLPWNLRKCRNVVVPSEDVRVRLSAGTGVGATTIRHWIDSTRFTSRPQSVARRALGLPQDRILLLNVSASTSNKNTGLLESLSARLPPRHSIVKVGPPLRGLRENVVHLGNLDSATYPLVFNACDAYLHPSISEGFGRPLIESMGSKLPIIATSISVTKEIVGDAALLLPTTAEPEDWVNAIEAAEGGSTRETLIAKLGSRTHLFSASAARDSYVRIYKSAFGL